MSNTPTQFTHDDHAAGGLDIAARQTMRLSANPKKAIQEMIDTIRNLHEIFVEENNALKRSDSKSFMALQQAKVAAALDYQDGVYQMLARKDEMKSADPELKKSLEKMQADFSKLANKNLKSLERMQKAVDRFGGTLREAARDAVKQDRVTSYTAHGKMSVDDIKRITTGSISETV
jgi:hypothetical protein